MMYHFLKKLPFLLLPFVLLVLIFTAIEFINSQSDVTVVEGAYPPPGVTPTNNFIPPQGHIFLSYLPSIFIPINWAELQVTVPPSSMSIYVSKFYDNFNNDLVGQAGCNMGKRDLNLPGSQDSFVFLDFGYLTSQNGNLGVMSVSNQFRTTNEIKTAVESYARQYYLCTQSDILSQITIGVGTNNIGSFVNTANGVAWANMIDQISRDINNSGYYTQVKVSGASDIELGWNNPGPTQDWINGVNSVFYDVYRDTIKYYFYNVGDANGCPSYGYNKNDPTWYLVCGSTSYPDWTAYNVYAISTGCKGCGAIPMVYSKDWTNAAQWQGLSDYAVDKQGKQMNINGSMNQLGSCQQHNTVATDPLCNTPENGFTKLYSSLNMFPTTATSTSILRWSTDIMWWPDIYQ